MRQQARAIQCIIDNLSALSSGRSQPTVIGAAFLKALEIVNMQHGGERAFPVKQETCGQTQPDVEVSCMPEPIDEPLVKKARVDSPPRIDVPEVEKPGTSSPKGKGKNQEG